ncbi:glycoside hydrolase family 104 protein [Stutzerimonas kunmingensis]|uniref:glycoside hydrolase family 24 protein n=1 Tax=Stutzerimonas kunmingensis TaxID=1211807 RepID=UPI001F457701|nr:glycoside hydrolase family 104 protein [Stutzerimonas kunmingensis]UIP34268.1 glycoside hydrolase family 104 protein [Stutzerimonas kunmingensis]
MPRISAAQAGGTNMLAFLDLIAWSEGTDNGRQPTRDRGYDVMVGGSLFDSYADHPRRLVNLPALGIKSTAAGRYQILARYWDHYRKQLGLSGGFTPLNQDRVALQLIGECKALDDIKAGRITDAIHKCRSRWASLPGAGYGQHEHKVNSLLAAYSKAGGALA